MLFLLNAQVIMTLIVLGILFLFVTVYKSVQRRRRRRSPFTDTALLRPPGYSLHQQIEVLSENLNLYLIVIFFSAMVFISMIAVVAEQKGVAPYPMNYPLHYAALVIIIGVCLYKMVRSMNRRNLLRLGYEGELVTAQELHKLMPEGNYVFHDFPADNFNIDHVVVGPGGVFAIETKTRSKRKSGNQAREARAEYNGEEIVFPDFRDKSYLDQARRQAKWLANWLKNATGEAIDVFPVVSLPGWYVDRKTRHAGTFVVNPKQLRSVIQAKLNHRVDGKKIQQINHQLEAKCRDIELISRQYDK